MRPELFSNGFLTPALAIAAALLGALLGVMCLGRSLSAAPGRARRGWLLLAAWSLGGLGVWVAQLLALIGLHIGGLRYRQAPTLLAAVIAIAAASLAVVAYRSSAWALLSGVLTGIGLTGANVAVVKAISVPAKVSLAPAGLAWSGGIALAGSVAGFAALTWSHRLSPVPTDSFGAGGVAVRRGRGAGVAFGALLLAVTNVTSCYAALAFVGISDPQPRRVEGALPVLLIGPVLVFAIAAVVVLAMALLSPDEAAPRPVPRYAELGADLKVRREFELATHVEASRPKPPHG